MTDKLGCTSLLHMGTPNAQLSALSHFELALANLTANMISLDREQLLHVKRHTDQLRTVLRKSAVDDASCKEDLQKGAALKSDNAFAEDDVDVDAGGTLSSVRVDLNAATPNSSGDYCVQPISKHWEPKNKFSCVETSRLPDNITGDLGIPGNTLLEEAKETNTETQPCLTSEKRGKTFLCGVKDMAASAVSTGFQELGLAHQNSGPHSLDRAVSRFVDEHSRSPSRDHENLIEFFRRRLICIFQEIDTDGTGYVDRRELRDAIIAVGAKPSKAWKLLSEIDKDGDNTISKSEWKAMVSKLEQGECSSEMEEFVDLLALRIAKRTTLFDSQSKRSRFMLSPGSSIRLTWDLLIFLLLLYIAMSLPISLAFGDAALEIVEEIVDLIFITDVAVNFRTGYINHDGGEVLDWRKVGCRYLKGWFLLDLCSSVPIHSISGLMLPNLQPAKLMKLGKVTKAVHVLRFGKLVRLWKDSDIGDKIDELMTSKGLHAVVAVLKLLVLSILVCHWMACLMLVSGEGFLKDYDVVDNTHVPRYLAALYWATMTMTTVGYGDITPISDMERLYCTVAMLLGGFGYAYVVGAITTAISESNLNRRAYKERMGLIQSWLEYHSEFPRKLRLRVCRYFREFLTQKTAMDDTAILNDLSPALRNDVCMYLINDEVRHNPLFSDIPARSLAYLVPILQFRTVAANETIVNKDDPGTGMYIITDGIASLRRDGDMGDSRDLCAGDSFGEEVLLGKERQYRYSVVAKEKVTLFEVPQLQFTAQLKSMPHLMTRILMNYSTLTGRDTQRPSVRKGGRSSLIRAGSIGIPPEFSDEVITVLHDFATRLDDMNTRMHGLSLPHPHRIQSCKREATISDSGQGSP